MNFSTAFGSSNKQCGSIRERLSGFVDDALANAERREVSVHLHECAVCTSHLYKLRQARMVLKGLPSRTPPPELTARLRVMAKRESAKRQDAVRDRFAALFAWDSLKVRFTNAARPLAIPFAGGIVSALVLFSMMVPAYPVLTARTHINDVPTAFYQEPSVKSVAPFGFAEDEVVIDVVLDEQGQVIDYSLPGGKNNAELRREIENQLLFARFSPATTFGQPIGGRMRLTFRRSQIDIKG
jgi:hypothetical protein